VVTDGTGGAAAIAGYTPAGKTGTARQPQAGGSYQDAEGRTHYDATFAGFVPAEAPAFTVLVLVRDPSKGDIYGGTVAAPAFARIGAAALRLFKVPPPSTDLVAGGTPVTVPPGTPPTTRGEPVGSSVERSPDGRVKVRPAGSTTTTAGPPPVPSTRRYVTTTTRARR
jgi:membrane peptidoglycan carboxypeptidase